MVKDPLSDLEHAGGFSKVKGNWGEQQELFSALSPSDQCFVHQDTKPTGQSGVNNTEMVFFCQGSVDCFCHINGWRILVIGPQDGRPLVCFHGGNTTNPITLSWFAPLVQKYRIYAPDTPGHPGKSKHARSLISLNGRLRTVGGGCIGCSSTQAGDCGGWFVRGRHYPESGRDQPGRLEKVILFVPSGIVSIPLSTLFFRLWIPLGLYFLTPSQAWLVRGLRPLFARDPIPEDMLEVTHATFKHVNIESKMPRVVTREEMARLGAPVLVIAAEKDELFPAQAVVKRAKEVFPNLAADEIIAGSPYFVSSRYHGWLCERIVRFIELGM